MKIFLLIIALSLSVMADGILIKESSCSVDQTMKTINAMVEKRGLRVFVIVDHQKNADSVFMKMNESKLIIFGNPKIGTSFMTQNMKSGLDLPVKILVYKDTDSKVKVAYRDGTWIAKEHNLSITQREAKINDALDKIITKAGTCTKD